jgi:hypothetical protein
MAGRGETFLSICISFSFSSWLGDVMGVLELDSVGTGVLFTNIGKVGVMWQRCDSTRERGAVEMGTFNLLWEP